MPGEAVGLGGAPEKVGWEQGFKDEQGFLPSRSPSTEKKETRSKGGKAVALGIFWTGGL